MHVVEDEFHFLMCCKLYFYDNHRQKLFSGFSDINIVKLMSAQDYDIIKPDLLFSLSLSVIM